MSRAKKGGPRPYLVKNSNIGTLKTFTNITKARKYKNSLNRNRFDDGLRPRVGLAHLYKLIE